MQTLVLLFVLLQDQPRRHVEDVSSPTWEYRVTHGGTMDGENCRSPLGGGFGIWTQTFESNRSVRMENVGDTDLVDPWLSNGRNNFRSMKEIVAGAVRPGMTDRERALAIWRLQTTHRFHAGAGDPAEMHDPVKVFNVYGYTTCGDDAVCLAGLWHAAGFPVSPGRHLGHRTSQVFFDGRWHLMDGDMGPIYLLRDNATVASEQDLTRDHDLVKRSHPQGILDPDRRVDSEEHAALFTAEADPAPDGGIVDIVRASTMAMVLRPGEAIVWGWGHGEKLKYHGHEDLRQWGPRSADGRTWGASASERICTGRWEYRPDFGREAWRRGVEAREGVREEGGALTAGTLIWRMKSPYVFVGGRLEAVGSGAKFSLSWDGTSWQPVGEDLDPFFPVTGPARYEYRLRCELPPGARLDRLVILNDVQMAPLALPGMTIGENRFVYADRSPGGRRVRITHEWAERSTLSPPAAPSAPVVPPDGGQTESTDITFEWSSTGEGYHFELSDREDLAWPLSSNFEKLIDRPRLALPGAGLLSAGRKYYWRVRARNVEGVWGPWSRTWTFTAGGLQVPVDVRVDQGVLRWKPVTGALRYLVYASDERGFSVSDRPYSVLVGRLTEVWPTNFVAETKLAELAVLGPGAVNKAWFRVVAVDESGARSGPSDAAAAPRPYIVCGPRLVARVGESCRGRVSSLRSLGDLRVQWVEGDAVAGYWDAEHPRFALRRGPSWLRVDGSTGTLSGVPDATGASEAEVEVTLERSVRRFKDGGARPWNLGLGKDPALDVVTEEMGRAVRRFEVVVEK